MATAAKFDVRFSITARQDKRIRAAINAIPDHAWQPSPYWLSAPEVFGADIAETAFTVFASDKRHARQSASSCVEYGRHPGRSWRCSPRLGLPRVRHRPSLPLAEVEADHRRHAIVEQTIAELKSAGLAHLPSVGEGRSGRDDGMRKRPVCRRLRGPGRRAGVVVQQHSGMAWIRTLKR